MNISLIASYVVTVIPMIFGLVKWNSLPNEMAIHFGLDGTPNGFAPKIVAVVVLPIILVALQAVVTLTTKQVDVSGNTLVPIIKTWIIPVVSIIVAIVIYRFALK